MDNNFPIVIASTVIRAAHKGEDHSGIYLVDTGTNLYECKIHWNDPLIDWSGRGGDRGLRGIAIDKNSIYLVASDEIFIFSPNFEIVASYRNRYLSGCHEICIFDDFLYITSTKFDSLLIFDLVSRCFVDGYCIRPMVKDLSKYDVGPIPPIALGGVPLQMCRFNPNKDDGPELCDTLHINSVNVENSGIFIGGTLLNDLLCISDGELYSYGRVPHWTHNCSPYDDKFIIANDTSHSRICVFERNGNLRRFWDVPKYREEELLFTESCMNERQGFGRGLCFANKRKILVAGSSPATITIYEDGGNFNDGLPRKGRILNTINLTMDIRCAIHGLEVWPF